MITPVRWEDGRLALIDQTRLPTQEVERSCGSWPEVAEAIRSLVVRGAPAIGVAAAFGVVLAARASRATDRSTLLADLEALEHPAPEDFVDLGEQKAFEVETSEGECAA